MSTVRRTSAGGGGGRVEDEKGERRPSFSSFLSFLPSSQLFLTPFPPFLESAREKAREGESSIQSFERESERQGGREREREKMEREKRGTSR